jgi:monovalent cation:H+ antiporter, CPA1 family
MQPTSYVAAVVGGVVLLLLIAAVTHAVTRRLKLPFTVVLVLVGIGLAGLSAAYPHALTMVRDLELSSALMFYVFLPTLTFEAAFNLDARQLRENLGPVLVLAGPGLLLSTLVIGLIVGKTTSIPFTAALLLGAILSATDPVAVLPLFRRLGAPQRLKVLVEGESLFNDATSIVLARLLLGVVLAGSVSGWVVIQGAVDFAVVFAGGLAVGWLLGLLTGYALGKVEDHFVEITLTTVLAYVSYLVAEEVVHVSGVMATIAAGLTIGGWGRMKISSAARHYLEHFWEYVAFVANALVFLLVGLRVEPSRLRATLGVLFWVVTAMLASRAAVIYGLMPIVQRLPGGAPMTPGYRAVIFWGGLRGAIALAIALSLPSFQHREAFVTLTMGAVLFTLLAQGLSIAPLVRWLGLDRPLLADRLAGLEGDYAAKRRAMDRLPDLRGSELCSPGVTMRLEAQYARRLEDTRAAIEDLHRTELVGDTTQGLLLSLRALAEEKSLYVDMFDKGHLSERAFRELLQALELRIDALRHRGAYEEAPLHRSVLRYVAETALRWIHRVAILAPVAERLHWHRIALDYEVATARLQGGRRVLDMLDTLGRVAATPLHVVDMLRHRYQEQYDRAQRTLDQLADHFPDWITDMQERLARRLLLGAEADAIAQQAEHGTLPAPVAERLAEAIGEELHGLQGHDVSKLKLEPIALVQRMPWFQDIALTDLANIAVRMQLQLVPERQVIVRQGEPGEYMYFIAHGVVRVAREERGVSRDLATLKAGEFFGETALLGDRQPRNATVTAVTPCTLYRLHRDELRVAMETQPAIRRVLEEESHKRAAGHQTG